MQSVSHESIAREMGFQVRAAATKAVGGSLTTFDSGGSGGGDSSFEWVFSSTSAPDTVPTGETFTASFSALCQNLVCTNTQASISLDGTVKEITSVRDGSNSVSLEATDLRIDEPGRYIVEFQVGQLTRQKVVEVTEPEPEPPQDTGQDRIRRLLPLVAGGGLLFLLLLVALA